MNRPFEPNVTRFKKSRRRYPKGIVKHSKLVKHDYGVMAITPGRIFSYHVETIRLAVVTFFKRQGKPFLRIMPNVSYTAKPHDIRRGRGKGSVDGWYFYAREGKILVEFPATTDEQAKRLADIIRSRLPIKTRLVVKSEEIKREEGWRLKAEASKILNAQNSSADNTATTETNTDNNQDDTKEQ